MRSTFPTFISVARIFMYKNQDTYKLYFFANIFSLVTNLPTTTTSSCYSFSNKINIIYFLLSVLLLYPIHPFFNIKTFPNSSLSHPIYFLIQPFFHLLFHHSSFLPLPPHPPFNSSTLHHSFPSHPIIPTQPSSPSNPLLIQSSQLSSPSSPLRIQSSQPILLPHPILPTNSIFHSSDSFSRG